MVKRKTKSSSKIVRRLGDLPKDVKEGLRKTYDLSAMRTLANLAQKGKLFIREGKDSYKIFTLGKV